jgi:predicted HNH restriction endonuclease
MVYGVKMGKKMPNTPRSRIKAAIRQLWLRSRERAAALKREGNCCQDCGVKKSVAKGKEQKMEVHHISGIDVWGEVTDIIADKILSHPDNLKVLCPDCHKEAHGK